MQRASDDRSPGGGTDVGSTLIEQLIAMMLITVVLLGLLGALTATARGIVVGRQRTLAVSLAKQAIETLEGAAYVDVATDLSSPGLCTDSTYVSGTCSALVLIGTGESIVPGGSHPYRTTVDAAGATFTLRTFVTSAPLTSTSGTSYRRITVIAQWLPTSSGSLHTLRFSSLVFPLDYTSYPSSSGSAEVTGGLITLVGNLGGETLNDVHVSLPGARADTNSSTLRTAIASAAGAASHVGVVAGPVVSSANCSTFGVGIDTGECPLFNDGSVADNDATTPTTVNWAASVGRSFMGGNVSTPGHLTVFTPAGTMTSRASTDVCGTCGFGDSDGLPWAESSVATAATSATFSSDHGAGALTGQLWNLSGAWNASAAVDHDTTAAGGNVAATAKVTTPPLHVFQVVGAPVGADGAVFDGAVIVSGFAATASASSGYGVAAPNATATAATVQLWDGEGYRTISVIPGTAFDDSATATFTVGAQQITFTSYVRSESSTYSTVGSGPLTDGVAQHPSVLLVTVEVKIIVAPVVTELTSTTTASSSDPPAATDATTTTVAPEPVVTDSFSIVVDYGRVSAHAAWLAAPA